MEDIEALEAGFVRSWVLSTGLLQKRTREISLAVARSSLSGAAFSSTPLDSLLTKRATHIYLVCFLVWSIRVLLGITGYALNQGRQGPLTNFIVSVDARRGACADTSTPGITTLGFSIDGKPLDSLSYETEVVDKKTLMVTFLEADTDVFVNGWWFETGLDTPIECDPVGLTVETSRDGMVTTAKLLQKVSFNRQIREGWVVVPEERGSNAFFDMRPDPTVYCDLTGYLLAVPGYIMCVVFALLQKEETARILYMLAFGLNWSVINSFVVLALYPMGQLRSDVTFYCLMLPCNIGFTLSLAFQQHFLLLNPLMSFYYFGLACYFTSVPAVINSLIMCVFWVYVYLHRYITIRGTINLMKPDKEQYDTIWAKIADSDNGHKSLQKLRHTVSKIPVRLQRPRQMQRIFTNVSALDDLLPQPRKSRLSQFMRRMSTNGDMFALFLNAPLSPKKEPLIPLQTIDQLYAQAPYMDLVLRRKVQEWAFSSDGMFSAKHHFITDLGSRYITWMQCMTDPDQYRKIKWCKVKSPDRAIEKIIRNYNRDGSLLVDCVRQSIIFENVEQLVTCLECVRMDPQVQILRVKNRLDPDYDGESSAGYRDVAINLCIVTEETRRLLLDMHVCEVQLVLRDFADIKTDDGHRRYISYRDLKGE